MLLSERPSWLHILRSTVARSHHNDYTIAYPHVYGSPEKMHILCLNRAHITRIFISNHGVVLNLTAKYAVLPLPGRQARALEKHLAPGSNGPKMRTGTDAWGSVQWTTCPVNRSRRATADYLICSRWQPLQFMTRFCSSRRSVPEGRNRCSSTCHKRLTLGQIT